MKSVVKTPAEVNGVMAGAHDEKRAVIRFIRGSSDHWMKEANKYVAARMFTMAADAEARAIALEHAAVDIEFGQHRRVGS